jgi:hypothetical protein
MDMKNDFTSLIDKNMELITIINNNKKQIELLKLQMEDMKGKYNEILNRLEK